MGCLGLYLRRMVAWARRRERLRENQPAERSLADLPDAVLHHILSFTVLNSEKILHIWKEGEKRTDAVQMCMKQWRWTGRLGSVCRIFREVSQEISPNFLVVDLKGEREENIQRSFMLSLSNVPWKRAKLLEIHCDTHHPYRIDLDAFLGLLETPESLPNLEKLSIAICCQYYMDSNTLLGFARALPRLLDLDVSGLWRSVDQFDNFGRLLRHPLRSLKLGRVQWMTESHLSSFLRHQGGSLVQLKLNGGGHLSDSALKVIARHCSRLEKLGLRSSKITVDGLSTFLQVRGGLVELDLSHCKEIGPEVVEVLNKHSPQLESLDVSGCIWFTNECLEHLVDGQIDRWACQREQIPLKYVSVRSSSVSRTGVAHVLVKPNVGELVVSDAKRVLAYHYV